MKSTIALLVPPDKHGFVRDTHYGCWHRRKFVDYSWPPLMLYYLHALIPGSVVVDAPAHHLDEDATLKKLASLDPAAVVTSVGTFTAAEDAPFLRKVKQELGCAIVLFGEFATTDPAAASRLADLVIRGEAEAAVKMVGTTLYLRKGVVDAGLVGHLDSLPFPKRVLEERDLHFNPFAKRTPFATVLASRGCPFECVFCTVPAVYGRSTRVRSPGNVIEELALLEEQGFREVFFRDENLTLHRRFLTEVCLGIIERGIDIQWMSNSRVDTVDERLLGLMHDAGCHLVKFGIESFSDATLRRINKGTSAEEARRAVSLCKEAGIDTVAHMLLGSPGESEGQILRNIEELMRVDPTYASFDIVRTYPRTALERMEERGEGTPIGAERLGQIHDEAFRRFYLRPKLLLEHMRRLGSPGEFISKARATSQLWQGLMKRKEGP